MIILVVAVALSFAGGVWLVASTLWPAPRPLTSALEHLHTPGGARRIVVPSTAPDSSLVVRVGGWWLRRVQRGFGGDERTLSDLEVVRRPVELHAGVTVVATVVGVGVGPLLWVVVAAAGTELPWLVPVWLMAMGAVVGFVAPRVVLRAEAARARADFRHALSAYLDVLVLLLAANEGPEAAMDIAARAGNGPAFMELRRATVQARLSGDPVWVTLDDLGRRVGVDEMRDVAAAGGLAGEHGAAVRKSLMAKARSLRTTSLAAAETAARRHSQAMFAPIVLMGMGFVLFLIYPLLTNIQLGT